MSEEHVQDTRGSTPRVALVVTSTNTTAALADYLDRLVADSSMPDVTIVVARSGDLDKQFKHTYASVRFVSADSNTSVAELRVLAMQHTEEDVVLLTDDCRPVPVEWLPGPDLVSTKDESTPFLSVVVVADTAATLDQSMPALLDSDVPREAFELIIVAEAASDQTALAAARYADTVVRLPGASRGPAYARNRGVEVGRGEVIVFVSPETRVHRSTLRRFAQLFARDRDLGGAIGSYDDRPADSGFVSQYRNLLHHYIHQQNQGVAHTFWAGLGAIRRNAFDDAGGFDEWHYQQPQIEDMELGRRMGKLGYRIEVRPDIQATALKRWTFGEMLRTDFHRRGLPWIWLLLKDNSLEGAATRWIERVCTGLVGATVLFVLWALWATSSVPLALAALATGAMLLLNRRFYWLIRARKGLVFAIGAMPLHFGYYLINGFSVLSAWTAHVLLGEPPPRVEAAAMAQIGQNTWPPVPKRPPKGIWSQAD